MNEIRPGSRFFGFVVPPAIAAKQHTEEGQLWIARELKSGWVLNGPDKTVQYQIVHHYSGGSEVIVS